MEVCGALRSTRDSICSLYHISAPAHAGGLWPDRLDYRLSRDRRGVCAKRAGTSPGTTQRD